MSETHIYCVPKHSLATKNPAKNYKGCVENIYCRYDKIVQKVGQFVCRSAGHELQPLEDVADAGDAVIGPQDGRDTVVDEERVQGQFSTRKKGL